MWQSGCAAQLEAGSLAGGQAGGEPGDVSTRNAASKKPMGAHISSFRAAGDPARSWLAGGGVGVGVAGWRGVGRQLPPLRL